MKGFFTSGYLVEDRERAPVDTLKVITPQHKSRPSTGAECQYRNVCRKRCAAPAPAS